MLMQMNKSQLRSEKQSHVRVNADSAITQDNAQEASFTIYIGGWEIFSIRDILKLPICQA